MSAGGALLAFVLSARFLKRGHGHHSPGGTGRLLGLPAFACVIFSAPLESPLLFQLGAALIGFAGGGLFSVGMLLTAMDLPERELTGLVLGAWGAVQATAAGVSMAIGGVLRDVVSGLATSGWLGTALNSPVTGYSFVFHLEIYLLFVVLIALGPLVRRSGQQSRNRSSHRPGRMPRLKPQPHTRAAPTEGEPPWKQAPLPSMLTSHNSCSTPSGCFSAAWSITCCEKTIARAIPWTRVERTAQDTGGWPQVPPPKTYKLADGREFLSPDPNRVDGTYSAATHPPLAIGAPLEPVGDPLLAGVGPGAWAARADHPDMTFEGEVKIVPLRVADDHGVAIQDTDPRGLPVLGADGEQAGTVKDMWVDRSEMLFRYIEVQLPSATRCCCP
jgi:hypothetical protein